MVKHSRWAREVGRRNSAGADAYFLRQAATASAASRSNEPNRQFLFGATHREVYKSARSPEAQTTVEKTNIIHAVGAFFFSMISLLDGNGWEISRETIREAHKFDSWLSSDLLQLCLPRTMCTPETQG